MPNAPANQNIPPQQAWEPPPRGFPMNSDGGPGFMPNPRYMPPPHQFDNYYPPVDMPSFDQQPRQGPPPYGRDTYAGVNTTYAPPQQSVVTKVIFFLLNLHISLQIVSPTREIAKRRGSVNSCWFFLYFFPVLIWSKLI